MKQKIIVFLLFDSLCFDLPWNMQKIVKILFNNDIIEV
jgi:hypothetical protein